MRLYLVQHGEAFSKELNPQRPLTKKGREDSTRTAEFLKASGISPALIWHSTKARAAETAQIFAERLLPKGGIEQKEGLAPNDPVNKVLAELTAIEKDVMIVGHLPFLQKLASLALTGSESNEIVKFSMAGAVCLEKEREGSWQLIFEIIPEILSR